MPFIPAEALSVSAFQSDVKGGVRRHLRQRFDARNVRVPSTIGPGAIVLMDRSLPSSNRAGETAPPRRGYRLVVRFDRKGNRVRRDRRQSRNWLMRLCRYIGVWLALSFAGLALAAESVPRSMLILHPSDVRGPFYYQVFSALRSAVNLRPGPP